MSTPESEQLLLSRERLRRALHEAGQDDDERKINNTPQDWISAAGTLPGATKLLMGAVRHWWRRHPVGQAGTVAAQTADAVVRPVAQQHPVALVAGALVVGAVLAWTRPWRWLPGTALLAGLAPQLLREVMRPRP